MEWQNFVAIEFKRPAIKASLTLLFRIIINNKVIFVLKDLFMGIMRQIYGNDFGMAFYWNQKEEVTSEKVQLVFKETGFHLTLSELEQFSALIVESKSRTSCCSDCKAKATCSRFLLQTPAKQIDLAVSIDELEGIHDLVNGTIFKMKLQNYILGRGRN